MKDQEKQSVELTEVEREKIYEEIGNYAPDTTFTQEQLEERVELINSKNNPEEESATLSL